MKQLLFVIFNIIYLFNITNLFAQTRISEFDDPGTLQRHIITTHNDFDYIVKINPNDSIDVFEIANGSSSYLHSNYIKDIYIEYNYSFRENLVFFTNARSSFVYDIVANDLHSIIHPNDEEYASWYLFSSFTDQIILRYGNINPKYKLLDLNQYQFVDFERVNDLRYAFDDYYLLCEYDDIIGRTYSVMDRSTGEIRKEIEVDRILSDTMRLIYYEDGRILAYDINSEVTSEIDRLSAGSMIYDYVKTPNYYIVKHFKEGGKSSSLIIDRMTLESIPTGIEMDEISEFSVSDHILFSNSNGIFLYNVKTGSQRHLTEFYDVRDVSVLCERYIYYPHSDRNNYLYDIVNHTSTYVNEDQIFRRGGVPMVINYDNGAILDFFGLRYFNKSDLTIEDSNIIPRNIPGLSKTAELVNINSDIVIFTNDRLFSIENNRIVELSEHSPIQIEYRPYKAYQEGISWLEVHDDVLSVFTYSDESKSKILELDLRSFVQAGEKNYFYDYHISDRYFYCSFNNGDRKLIKVNLDGLDQIVRIYDVSNFSSELGIEFKGDFYYTSGYDSLHIIQADHSLNSIEFSKYSLSGVEINDIVVDGRYFVYGNGGIFEMIDGEPVEILQINGFSMQTSFFRFKDFVISSTDFETFIYTDGVWKVSEVFPPGRYEYLDSNIVSVYDRIYGRQIFFDPVEKKEIKIEEIENGDIIRHHFVKDDRLHYIVDTEDQGERKLSLFRLSTDYSTSTLLNERSYTGYDRFSGWQYDEGKGLYHSRDTIFYMGNDFRFYPIEDFVTDRYKIDVVSKDGVFYFFGLDSYYGRQIYSLDKLTVSTDQSPEFLNIHLYPNPTQNQLTILNDELSTPLSYEIVDMQGRRVMQNKLSSNQISISSLATGTYILVLRNGNQQWSEQFVKF